MNVNLIAFHMFQPAMAQTDDGDDYWNTSSFKPFNFNEDDYEEDSIEKIQWDGTPATTTTSIKYVQTLIHLATASIICITTDVF